jgi:hypothetical protein
MTKRKRRRPSAPGPSGIRDVAAVEHQRPAQGVEGLVGFIATGSLDEHLGVISRAIVERRRHLLRRESIRAMGRVDVGDRVRIGQEVRPMYLRGRTGTVTGWTGKNVVVLLDLPAGRHGSEELRCPPLLLELIERAPRRVVP